MRELCQAWPPLTVNQTACPAVSTGTATPCARLVMPMNLNPPGGPAEPTELATRCQLAPPSDDHWMPLVVAMTISPPCCAAIDVTVPAETIPACCHDAPPFGGRRSARYASRVAAAARAATL